MAPPVPNQMSTQTQNAGNIKLADKSETVYMPSKCFGRSASLSKQEAVGLFVGVAVGESLGMTVAYYAGQNLACNAAGTAVIFAASYTVCVVTGVVTGLGVAAGASYLYAKYCHVAPVDSSVTTKPNLLNIYDLEAPNKTMQLSALQPKQKDLHNKND